MSTAEQPIDALSYRCSCRQNLQTLRLVLVTCLLIVAACAQTPTPTVETVEFAILADTSTAPLMDELVSAYLNDRTHVTIRMASAANAERAVAALQAGQSDLATVSWLPNAEKAGDTLWYRPFARDSIIVIIHPTNSVGGLTLLQLRDIFQARTLFWTDLGGPALDIIPVSREEGAGTRLSFESLVMKGRDVAPTAVIMPSNKAVVEYVSATPGAIGYVAPAWLTPVVNLLTVEGITPSPASVMDGRYLLARPLFLIARAEPTDGVAEFVEWVKEGEGQVLVKRGYALAP